MGIKFQLCKKSKFRDLLYLESTILYTYKNLMLNVLTTMIMIT